MAQTQQTTDQKNSKSEDKQNIEQEEREKILNSENEEKVASDSSEEKKTKEVKEGMEVKPKKIPIGGIQMPGFFTRSKSKEQCKEEGDQTEGTELIEDANKDETPTPQAKIKLLNPFRKSKATSETDEEKTGESKDKKNLLQTIRLPLVSVFSKKKKEDSQNLNSQTGQAGLASMETLDDKSNDGKSGELKSVPLDDKKDVEKQESDEDLTLAQRVKTYRIAISALLIFLVLIVIIVIIARQSASQITAAPIRDSRYVEAVTTCGKVEGLLEDSAFAFRGIPYARPPTGDLRFKYAQPLNRIEYCWNGTFLAHNATDPCMQILGNGTVIGSEDCLTLDVITPYVRYDNPLPVIVLVGAETLMGGSPGKMRPSARYARSRDVVFVRPNFRLGALGFLALDTLSQNDSSHASGNYGLSDILEALHWIQLNIEHFGGDKKSVTLFGHRAGATLVTALSTLPDAAKYFARAWASSGGAVFPKKSRAESESENKSFLEAAQCKNVECLRSLDATTLVTAVEDTWRKPQPDVPSAEEKPENRHQWLVLDGNILKEHPDAVWTNGELPVKLVLGATAHAANSEKLFMKHLNWTEPLVRRHLEESALGARDLVDDTLQLYPPTYGGLSAIVTDIRIACPLFAVSTQMSKVPFYVVTQTRGEQHLADVDSDVEAILGRYEPKTPEQRRYFSAMQGLFYHYVWHGTVEQDAALPPSKKVLVIGQDVLPNETYSHCAFWIGKDIVPAYATMD
ncbi:neurotactin [Cylas formicarius]|uniref:neurotactin n=1 Tax=Cylas formicarius TaxID=197179 RepID=UPI002958B1B6|nr:neurotactin [Cylas formicarius]XP_060530746.1 neurotactin [Cylas formicarius]